MFSLSSLVGSARTGPTQLEFTPIGKRTPRASAPNSSSQTPLASNYNINRDKVPTSRPESPYDSTPGRFDSTFTLEGIENVPGAYSERRPKSQNTRDRYSSNIVGDGTSSIQKLKSELKELLSENYNLKVEVATLKQYLKQSPLDTRDLTLENTNLKQEIFSLTRKMESMPTTVEIPEQKELFQEQERELRRLQATVQELTSRESRPVIPDEILDKIEFLENDNQSLRRQLQDMSAGRVEVNVERENELKTEVHRLKSKLASLPPDVEDHVRDLATENEVLSRKFKLVLEDAKQLQNERDSLQDLQRAMRIELDARNQEVSRLASDLNDYSSKSKSLANILSELQASKRENEELSGKFKAAQRDLADFQSKTGGAERNNRRNIEELEGRIQTIQNKLQAANESLKEKDFDNFELRAELRSLMDERSGHFDNQSMVKHYQAQIERLRQKEEVSTDEILALRTEITSLKSALSAAREKEEKLIAEAEEIQSKLNYYEEQYSALEDARSLADSEVELLEAKLKKAEDQISFLDEKLKSAVQRREHDERTFELEKEVETLRARLRRTELSDAQKYNESALWELEHLHKKREDAEKLRLTSQICDLEKEISQLERDLEIAKSGRWDRLERDAYNTREREINRLQSQIEDKEQQAQEQRLKAIRLAANVRDKDATIDELEARVRDLTREVKYSSSDRNARADADAEHEIQIRNLRFEHEKRLRDLQLENERLERSLKEELRYCKAQLETFLSRDGTHSEGTLAMVALLEIQVEQTNRVNRELTDKLKRVQQNFEDQLRDLVAAHRTEIQTLLRSMENLQSQFDMLQLDYKALNELKETLRTENLDLRVKQARVNNERDELQEKCEKLRSQVLHMESMERPSSKTSSEIKSLQTQVSELHTRNESLQRKLEREQRAGVTSESLRTENELLRAEKNRLDLKARNLSLELSKTSAACTKLANKVKELEVVQYKKKLTEEDIALSDLTAIENRLLMNKLIYNKASAIDTLARCEVLRSVNTYAISQLKKVNSRRSPAPRYMGSRKVTFKTVAQAALGMVRMRRMGERGRKRNKMLEQIQMEITRDKNSLVGTKNPSSS